jgi:hypothetical protein
MTETTSPQTGTAQEILNHFGESLCAFAKIERPGANTGYVDLATNGGTRLSMFCRDGNVMSVTLEALTPALRFTESVSVSDQGGIDYRCECRSDWNGSTYPNPDGSGFLADPQGMNTEARSTLHAARLEAEVMTRNTPATDAMTVAGMQHASLLLFLVTEADWSEDLASFLQAGVSRSARTPSTDYAARIN